MVRLFNPGSFFRVDTDPPVFRVGELPEERLGRAYVL